MGIEDKGVMSRRRFLQIAGSAAAYAALWQMGARSAWAQNSRAITSSQFGYSSSETDVLVAGSGIAGLFAAIKAHDAGAGVLMVSKGRLGTSGQTPFARGIFSYNAATSGMTLDEFTEAVSEASLGTSNPVYARQMAEHSAARVAELREWGFFDTNLFYNVFNRPVEDRNIPVMERIMITNLLKENGRIAGVAGFSLDSAEIHVIRAKSVILCTGAGGFKPNGFPICDLTHDGSVMAYRIGARITGKEWNDGHVANAEHPAACYNGWERVLEEYPSTASISIRQDLGVEQNLQAYMNGNPFSMMPPERPEGPPGGNPGEMGPPPEDGDAPPGMGGTIVGGASAGMSIHKSEGLVPVNDRCGTDIPGLYAAGDALGSHMAGGIYTQIGSSMAGSAVQGAIAGEAAAEFSVNTDLPVIHTDTIDRVKSEILAPLNRDEGYGPAWVTQVLQSVMIPNFILYIKKENLLRAALAYVEELRDHHVPMLRAADTHELRLAHETGNMIVNAEMKLRASLMRKESRCSHYRLDYPDIDTADWNAWINISKDPEGNMKLEKQPFDSWPD